MLTHKYILAYLFNVYVRIFMINVFYLCNAGWRGQRGNV